MTIGMRRLVVVACFALLTVVTADSAHGFFPKGGFNLSGQLRYAIWPFREFDTNSNGIIEPGEGLEFRIEGGPRGFTSQEIDLVKAGFKTWQDVPTSYVAFRFSGVIEDPIIPGSGLPDYLPMVFMQVTEVAPDDGYTQLDPPETLVPELAGPIPAITLLLYTIDTTAVPVDNRVVIVPAGSILECDIIVNASLHRHGVIPESTFGTLDLQATITHQVGHLLGLAPTPLNNLDPFNEVALEGAAQGLPVEPAVLQMTGADGIPRRMGATPTMFPIYFLTEHESGDHVAGWRDLAPDDISGISWLYPREDGLENYFTIKHEARTHVRQATGIPSSPVSGGHVVAWANVSGGNSDRRVPVFSTMTGLYEKYSNIQLTGRFHLMGLWKQMEVLGRDNELFEPSYVLTLNPLNGLGYDRQAPPGFSPEQFDSIQGAFPISFSTIVRPAGEFSTNYPSEVFNEHGTVYGIDNNGAGTPLVWDFTKNTVVSADTGRTLPRMLPRSEPMFGDADAVCIMNIIENVGGGAAVPAGNITVGRINNQLRGVRDDVLLRSAVGTAIVDLYYRTAPYAAYYLMRSERAMELARATVLFSYWIWERLMTIALMLLLAAVTVGYMRKRRYARIVATGALLAVFWAVAAHASQLPVTTEDLVAESTYIVSGKVVSAEGRQGRDGRIYTDVVFEVEDVAKGDLNRGSTITFSVIGGRLGTLVLAATGIPSFFEGEHAVLHLLHLPDYGLVPYGGYRSKISVYVDPETEEEEVIVGDDAPEPGIAPEEGEQEAPVADEDAAEKSRVRTPIPAGAQLESRAGRMPVREYMRYLRAIANSQR